jgi:hypothetical protein
MEVIDTSGYGALASHVWACAFKRPFRTDMYDMHMRACRLLSSESVAMCYKVMRVGVL